MSSVCVCVCVHACVYVCVHAHVCVCATVKIQFDNIPTYK